MKNLNTITCMVTLITISLVLLLCPMVQAQVAIDSPEYWCGASWPPVEGGGRTRGIDVNGDVCIKIVKEVEKIVEVEKLVEKPIPTSNVTVTLSSNDKGEPTIITSCPSSGFSEWDFKALEAGYKMKLKSKNGEIFIIWEK